MEEIWMKQKTGKKLPNQTGYNASKGILTPSKSDGYPSRMKYSVIDASWTQKGRSQPLLCSEERRSIPHGCQAPFRQKYEKKFSSHLSACQRGILTPAREHKDTFRL